MIVFEIIVLNLHSFELKDDSKMQKNELKTELLMVNNFIKRLKKLFPFNFLVSHEYSKLVLKIKYTKKLLLFKGKKYLIRLWY